MRPSDVPTYVEAGAADLGITGKDVLLEQPDRIVYEVLDLATAPAAWSWPGGPATRPRTRTSGAWAGCGSRRSTRGSRNATSRRPAAAAEVIEVKGSVELAPLSGLADGIVDLVATGRTLAENGLEIREEIATSTARLIANRVSHKLRAARSTTWWSGCVRRGADADRAFDWDGRDSRGARGARFAALQPALGEVSEPVAEIVAAVRERGDDRRDGDRGAVRRVAPVDPSAAAGCRRREIARALERMDPEMRAALDTAAANIRAVAEAQLADERRVELEQGQSVEMREVPVGSAGIYAPGGSRCLPLDRPDGLHAGEDRRSAARRGRHPPAEASGRSRT